MSGWIGVDLDGTLAHYDSHDGIERIGPPVGLMLARVKEWLAKGMDVRIVTARASLAGPEGRLQRELIEAWCVTHLGKKLLVTCSKDFGLIELWDDRAVQVIPNTGIKVTSVVDRRHGSEVQ